MAKIFISYRRDDSQYQADKLHAALKPYVRNAKDDIFIDVDNIPFGVDFATHLANKVSQCQVLLALIGDEWLDVRDPKTGARRLDDPEDFVRIEIASALTRGIPVVPILLDGAKVPDELDLPEDLQPLARRNGIPVSRTSFASDVARLVEGLPVDLPGKRRAKAVALAQPSSQLPGWIAGSLVAACVAGGVAFAVIGDPFNWSGPIEVRRDIIGDEPISEPGEPVEGEPEAAVTEISATLTREPAAVDANPEADPSASTRRPNDTRANDAATTTTDTSESPRAQTPVKTSFNVRDVFRDPFRDGAGQGPEMVVVGSGTFEMGSPSTEDGRDIDEGPVRTVRIESAFAAGKFEVTWDEYLACAAEGVCVEPEDDGFGKGRRPVTLVNWKDAESYVNWLTSKTGANYRLLTEAEWEYSARGGTTGRYHNNGAEPELCNIANGADAATKNALNIKTRNMTCSDGIGTKTARVGSFSENSFGLYDVHGNVWEWVQDCKSNSYLDNDTDTSTRQQDNCDRIIRGGAWNVGPLWLRSANRDFSKYGFRTNNVGFRVARDLDNPQ